MKDIYELLNDIDIDFSDVEKVEVNEIERERGKRKLMNSIKKNKVSKKKICVAAATIAIIGVTSLTMSNPALAQNIPFIGSLVQNNLINVNNQYENYLNIIGQTKSNEGIDVTFENAIADSNMLFLSFVVKNNNETISEDYIDAMLIPSNLKVNNKEINTSGVATHEIIDENTIRILYEIEWDYNSLPDKFNIDIDVSKMFGKIGDWGVKFSMDTKEIKKNTYIENVNKTFNSNGIDFKVNEVTISPLTTNIKYYIKSEDENISMDFLILDQDGNEVKGSTGRMTSKGCDDFVKGRIDCSMNYINNKNIKELNLIPIHSNWRVSGNDKEIIEHKSDKEIIDCKKISLGQFKPFEFKPTENLSIDVNSCTVDEDKLIVKYNYKYGGKKIVKWHDNDLFIKSNNIVLEQIQGHDIGEKYKDPNSNVSIYKIDNNKEIEIGCYNKTAKELLEKEAFKVIKK